MPTVFWYENIWLIFLWLVRRALWAYIKLHISDVQPWEAAIRNGKMACTLICLPFFRFIIILLSCVGFMAPSISVPEKCHLNSVVDMVLQSLFLIIYSICLPFVWAFPEFQNIKWDEITYLYFSLLLPPAPYSSHYGVFLLIFFFLKTSFFLHCRPAHYTVSKICDPGLF